MRKHACVIWEQQKSKPACASVQSDQLQCNPFITLYLGSNEMNSVVSELCYKGEFYKGVIGK